MKVSEIIIIEVPHTKEEIETGVGKATYRYDGNMGGWILNGPLYPRHVKLISILNESIIRNSEKE